MNFFKIQDGGRAAILKISEFWQRNRQPRSTVGELSDFERTLNILFYVVTYVIGSKIASLQWQILGDYPPPEKTSSGDNPLPKTPPEIPPVPTRGHDPN